MVKENYKLKTLYDFKHAKIMSPSNIHNTLIVKALSNFIPESEFQEIFHTVGKLARGNGIKKLIFDKSELRIFHQPSMEWYFSIWKEEMYHIGLVEHRKILPNDSFFVNSVHIGRQKINEKYPAANFHKMSIKYVTSIDQGIDE